MAHCICGLVEPFFAHCNLLILQHPHERRKYYSSTKIVLRAIKNSRLERRLEFSDAEMSEILSLEDVHLLYPSKAAVDCESVNLTQRSTVIVVDGTWDEAQKIVYRNKPLQTLPAISFSKPLVSNYRIRKQPKSFCLSTLESVAHLLRLNALATGCDAPLDSYESLLRGFDRMVEQQLSYTPWRL